MGFSTIPNVLNGMNFQLELVTSDIDYKFGIEDVFYTQDVVDIFHIQLELVHRHQADLLLFEGSVIPDKRRKLRHIMDTDFAKDLYNVFSSAITRKVHVTACGIGKEFENVLSFVGMIQVYTEKTATSTKWDNTIMHPVPLLLPNVTTRFYDI